MDVRPHRKIVRKKPEKWCWEYFGRWKINYKCSIYDKILPEVKTIKQINDLDEAGADIKEFLPR